MPRDFITGRKFVERYKPNQCSACAYRIADLRAQGYQFSLEWESKSYSMRLVYWLETEERSDTP